MPVNIDLADASNALLVATLVLYALAMLAYACDFAFARQRVLAGVETPVRVAVGPADPRWPSPATLGRRPPRAPDLTRPPVTGRPGRGCGLRSA